MTANLPDGARTKLENRLLSRRRRRKWLGLAVLGAAAAAAAGVVATVAPGSANRHVASPNPSQARSRTSAAATPAPSPRRAALGAVGGPSLHRPPEKGAAPAASALPVVSVPVVSSLTPREGPTAGGTWVTIRGSGLSEARAVYFGQAECQKVVAVSAGELRVLAPAHARGTVAVEVRTSAGRSRSGPGARYTFGG